MEKTVLKDVFISLGELDRYYESRVPRKRCSQGKAFTQRD